MRDNVVPLRRAFERGGNPSDEALLAACGRSESFALGLLFDRYQERLFRFASRLLASSRPDVDDLVQATFLEVWRSAGRFRSQSSALTWIFGIATNLARHRARSEQRQTVAMRLLTQRPEGAAPALDEAASRRELVQRLAEALPRLPQPLREAFVLCDVEELPGTEAAQIIGVPPGTLWRRLHEARKELRAALEEPS